MADCFESVQACLLRVAKLDAAGAPLAGSANMYVSDAIIDLGINMQVTKGAKKQVKNGCGSICATVTEDDTIDGCDLTMTLCQLDADLIGMMTDATVIASPYVGLELPPPGSTLGNGVSLEAWTLAWDSDEQATEGGDLQWFHWVFPKTKWTIGNTKLDENILQVPMTGTVYADSNFGNGPANDLPHDFSWVGWFRDNAFPTAGCSPIPVPAGS